MIKDSTARNILDAFIEFVTVISSVAAMSALLAAFFALLTGEFAYTRQYLFEMALVSALVTCAFGFGTWLSRQRRPGEH